MPPVVTVPESPCPKVPFEQNNLCPYPIPKTDEIVKDIERAAYQVDTFKFVSDLFECGAIAISNQVDHFNRDEREERYMQIIKTYQPDQQKSLAEIFAKIYALLSSVWGALPRKHTKSSATTCSSKICADMYCPTATT